MNYDEINATAAAYGVVNTNPMTEQLAEYRDKIDYSRRVQLTDKDLVRITRLRLLGDPGPYAFPFFDVSYCYGELADGTVVDVQLPQWQFPKRGVRRHITDMCRKAGVYGKGLGIIDDEVLSICM
jgi:hypothetical protein